MKLSNRALNRALLARQHLLTRTKRSALELVEHLAGLQSQAPLSPYFALLARSEDFTPHELSTLLEARKVVRLALLRSTVHLVSSEDARWMRPTVQPAIDRLFKHSLWSKQLKGVELRAAVKHARELLETTPSTPEALGRALMKYWPNAPAAALAQLVRTEVPLVQTPPRGLWGRSGPPRATSLERWLGAERTTADLERLVRRYLAAFGPASVQDAETWSGVKGLAPVFESLGSELIPFTSEDTGRALFDLPDAPRPDEDTPAPVRLLGDFDQTLIAYADRSRILEPQWKAKVMTPNGLIRPVILVDGMVAGQWSPTSTTVTLFARVPPPIRRAIDRELIRIRERTELPQSRARGANSSVM